MMINADIFVRDVPGQLVGSLEPISLVDGNIVGVVHNRDSIVNGRIAVNITFEVDSADVLERLKSIWKSRDVMISRITSVVETYPMEYLLIGDLGPSQIERLIDGASKEVQLESVDIRFLSKTSDKKRTAMISASVRSSDDIMRLNKYMSTACKKANIVFIRGVGK
jgi:ACT domain-containing protein